MRVKSSLGFILAIGILQCFILCVSPETDTRIVSRNKRFLLFEPGVNYIQLIIGIGVPLELKNYAVVFGWAFRAIYSLPSNLSQLMPMDLNTRRKRSVSRWDIYNTLGKITEMKGLGGKSCILRSICEVSDIPFDKHNGFFEEVVHALFTPSTTNEDVHHHTDNEYYAAQKLGKTYKGKCKQLFPDCVVSLMDIFTRISDQNF